MTITDIKIRKIIPEGRLRAVISITVDDQIAIHDIKVVQGDARLFVAMPSRRDDAGNFRDIVHPISPEAREELGQEIRAENHPRQAFVPPGKGPGRGTYELPLCHRRGWAADSLNNRIFRRYSLFPP